jgi:tellurite resistance protein TehA-like permease
MGIGMSSNLLYGFPFPSSWLKTFGVVVWGINIGLFAVSNILFIARLALFKGQLRSIASNHSQPVFTGCYPMGLLTLVNMVHNIYGERGWVASYVMWWYAVFWAVFSSWVVVHSMFTIQNRTIDCFNSSVLLLVVAVVVAAASGGLISQDLPPSLRQSTLVVSAMLMGNGQAVAFIVTTIYVYRLFMVGHPALGMSIGNFLPVGPLGQGTYGILNIAVGYADLLSSKGYPESVSTTIEHVAVGVGLLLMGYASFWMFVACITCMIRRPPQFSMGWWGLTFPVGTYALGWIKLAAITDIYAFKVLGALFSVVVLLNTFLCGVLTIRHGLVGNLIFDQSRDELSDEKELGPQATLSSAGTTWNPEP